MKDIFYDKQSDGCYKNLENQIHSIMKHTNESSIKTRYRYEAATERFCAFLAKEYKLQKFENVKSKHIIAYAEFLKSEGKSASTIKTDLAGVRYFHRHSGSKNVLVDNSKLNLEQRQFAKIDRSWTTGEIETAKSYAKEIGRTDVYAAINLSAAFGLRLEEVCKVTPSHLRQALSDGELWTKGKNGQERYIQIRNEHQTAVIKETLVYADQLKLKSTDKIVCNQKESVQKTKRSIQNFISNHQHKFIDINRTDIKDTNKIKQTNINFHGLRYYYCNTLYEDLTKNFPDNYNKSEAKRYCSEQLGHHRESVTDIYLK